MGGELTKDKAQELCDTFTVDVLGTPYTVRMVNEDEDPKLEKLSAYCDSSVKKIVIAKRKPETLDRENLKAAYRENLRHELVHAFLSESGLEWSSHKEWAVNEEMVDWIALQFPKLVKAFEAAGAME